MALEEIQALDYISKFLELIKFLESGFKASASHFSRTNSTFIFLEQQNTRLDNVNSKVHFPTILKVGSAGEREAQAASSEAILLARGWPSVPSVRSHAFLGMCLCQIISSPKTTSHVEWSPLSGILTESHLQKFHLSK